MIGLIAAVVIMGAFGLWLLNALWSLDHNPHGGPEEADKTKWKEGYDD
jgi:hypothetical protein